MTGQDDGATDRRTELAADRTLYAAERTYGAWMRTGLAALASGVAAKPLLAGALPDYSVRGAGAILTLFSIFCFGAAVWREIFGMTHALKTDARRIPPLILYVVNALLSVVGLLACWAVTFG